MSETSQEARRALTEERGKELEKWWAINFVRFMNSQDPISPTLSDMPTEILVQVLEKSGSLEQLICRKVCRSLRATVEKFGILFDFISFKVSNVSVAIVVAGLRFVYNAAANGTSIVTYNTRVIMVKGENFLHLAFKDLGTLLKRVRAFEIVICGQDKHAIAKFLLNILKTNQCVHVKKIMLNFLNLDDICLILPYFDCQMLESIHLNLYDTNEQPEQLVQLEQWKNSEACKLYGSLGDNIPIQHLLHFKNITVLMKEFSLQKMVEVRDKLLTRSTFEECTFWLKNSNQIENIIEIARVFQLHYSGSGEFEIEYSCNNDKFKISCEKSVILQEWRLNIKRC